MIFKANLKRRPCFSNSPRTQSGMYGITKIEKIRIENEGYPKIGGKGKDNVWDCRLGSESIFGF